MWRLANPRVIVEHYTASNSLASTFATFAADAPDGELGELPGVCSHFVIDRDGTIYRLVRLDTICRHTVGLNWTSFGIEHVGTSARQVLGNPHQLASSLALTAWLMSRYRIELRNVIGHNESLTSPYHRERYAAWRCQTHGDWRPAEMRVYRAALARLARSRRVRLGPAARPVDRCRPDPRLLCRRTWARTSAPSLRLRTASAKPFPGGSAEDRVVSAAGMSTTVASSRKRGMPSKRARTDACTSAPSDRRLLGSSAAVGAAGGVTRPRTARRCLTGRPPPGGAESRRWRRFPP
jgi:hypothetical protein